VRQPILPTNLWWVGPGSNFVGLLISEMVGLAH